jgi:hypothetical protein
VYLSSHVNNVSHNARNVNHDACSDHSVLHMHHDVVFAPRTIIASSSVFMLIVGVALGVVHLMLILTRLRIGMHLMVLLFYFVILMHPM